MTLDEGDSLGVIARAAARHVALIQHNDDGPKRTLEMLNAGGADWRVTIADVRQNFRYRVATGISMGHARNPRIPA